MVRFICDAQYLHVSFGSTGGLLEDYHADVQYRYRRALSIGAGYEFQETHIDLLHDNPSGIVHLKVNGPEVFLRASF